MAAADTFRVWLARPSMCASALDVGVKVLFGKPARLWGLCHGTWLAKDASKGATVRLLAGAEALKSLQDWLLQLVCGVSGP